MFVQVLVGPVWRRGAWASKRAMGVIELMKLWRPGQWMAGGWRQKGVAGSDAESDDGDAFDPGDGLDSGNLSVTWSLCVVGIEISPGADQGNRAAVAPEGEALYVTDSGAS